MKSLTIALALAALGLSGCQSYSPQRYTAMPDNTPILKALSAGAIKVAPFVLSTAVDASCRGVGDITPPVNMSFEGYLQTALADEIKVAGLYDEKNPKVVLSGRIDRLNFSSSKGLTNGEWNIGLKITSSNGKSMYVSESYQFESAFEGGTACRRTAEAFLPAVQNVITKIFRSTEFRPLLGI
ncbi:hypothetical protein LP415_25900 [Polaromonas sp. P1(28)-8]|nr:hypothetical protein LP415_25900 [Polaromonas sp. P1(28)-8]